MSTLRKLSVIVLFAFVFSNFSGLLMASSPETKDIISSTLSPINPNANQTSKNILNYLGGFTDNDQFVLGAFNLYGSSGNLLDYDNYNNISKHYGVTPGLFSAHYTVTEKETNTSIINNIIEEKYNQNCIILVHNNNEWGNQMRADYPDDKTNFVRNFDATNADRNEDVYQRYLAVRKKWADGIEELKNKGVTVIYRPFVEMNNPGFGTTLADTPDGYQYFINVWRQLVDYFVKDRNLDNVLFGYSPTCYFDNDWSYYPGDDYVDVVGVTCYNETPLYERAHFFRADSYLATGKPFGFFELGGNLKVTTKTDWSQILKTITDDIPQTSFVNLWGGNLGIPWANSYNCESFLDYEGVVQLTDVPDLHTGEYASVAAATLYDEMSLSGTGLHVQPGSYTWDNIKKIGISFKDVKSLKVRDNYKLTLYTGKNFDETSWIFIGSIYNLAKFDCQGEKIQSFKLEKCGTDLVSLNKPTNASAESKASSKVVDGRGARWTTDKGTGSWVSIDLQGLNVINRYEVDHAQSAGEAYTANTSCFKLQYSQDNIKWNDADVVINNANPKTVQIIEEIEAKYVRVYICDPNSSLSQDDDTACLSEISLYGFPVAEKDYHRKAAVTLPDNTNNNKVNDTVISANPVTSVPNNLIDDTPQDNSDTVFQNETDIVKNDNSSTVETTPEKETTKEKATTKSKTKTKSKDKQAAETSEASDSNLYIILAVVGCIVVIGVAVLLVVYFRKRAKNR